MVGPQRNDAGIASAAGMAATAGRSEIARLRGQVLEPTVAPGRERSKREAATVKRAKPKARRSSSSPKSADRGVNSLGSSDPKLLTRGSTAQPRKKAPANESSGSVRPPSPDRDRQVAEAIADARRVINQLDALGHDGRHLDHDQHQDQHQEQQHDYRRPDRFSGLSSARLYGFLDDRGR